MLLMVFEEHIAPRQLFVHEFQKITNVSVPGWMGKLGFAGILYRHTQAGLIMKVGVHAGQPPLEVHQGRGFRWTCLRKVVPIDLELSASLN